MSMRSFVMDPSSRQPRGLRRKQLECPFTWGIPVQRDATVLMQEYDALPLASDTWGLVVSKICLAYQYAMRNNVKRSRKLLVECYIPLLEVKGIIDIDSDMIGQYKTALKHVIDSMWAFVCCKTSPIKEVEPFLQTITPFPTMTDLQKSAIWGIRSRLPLHEEIYGAVKTAVSLNPSEGQWHLNKALILMQMRLSQRRTGPEELRMLQESYRLRPSREATVTYSLALLGKMNSIRKPSDLEQGYQILCEALETWPDSPYVNYKCGVVLHKHLGREQDLDLAEKCLRKVVTLVGPAKCKIACTELGVFLIRYKDAAEGKTYIQMAKEVEHD